MTQASDFAKAIGRRQLAQATGVGLTAISNAVVRNKFPASWYLAAQDLAAAKGIPCPPDLFGMKAPNDEAGAA